MKGIFARRSVIFQSGVLLTAVLIGYFAATIFTIPLLLLHTGGKTVPVNEQPVSMLSAIQLIAAVCIFLLPAVGTAWLCSERPRLFLHISPSHRNSKLLLPVACTLLLFAPTISLTSYLNSLLTFPEWMAPVEQWMKAMEAAAAELTHRMLSQKGILALGSNLIVIAVVAGVTEEFIFRGTLFSILQKAIKNHHIVIWVVAILFSAIHFQFYGFIPRMLLGAYLGYLLYWTQNIRIPVFAHILHNAIAVVGMSTDSFKDHVFFAETIPAEDLVWFSAVALISFIFFIAGTAWIRKTA
ncbi:MAG: CPBP family intramembrane metalloprotease, partial [Tannerella sp.]|nr:CPBP family intramembrane metalloprotease [Tannerella sp.]